MIMKVSEFIKGEYDIDVYDDMTEELGVCAVCPIKLTAEGKKEFADVLEYEMPYMNEAEAVAVVHVEDEEELERAKLFFYGAAGYIGVSKYDKWFKEV